MTNSIISQEEFTILKVLLKSYHRYAMAGQKYARTTENYKNNITKKLKEIGATDSEICEILSTEQCENKN